MVNGTLFGSAWCLDSRAMPPLAATLAIDRSPPWVTVSACSPVLSGSLSRAHHSRLCLPQAPPLLSSPGGEWLREPGHHDTTCTQGWRIPHVSFPARAGSGHLWVVLPSDYPRVQRGGPLGACTRVLTGWRRETSPGSAGTTLPRLSVSFQRLRPPGGQRLGLTTVCPAQDMEHSGGSAAAVYRASGQMCWSEAQGRQADPVNPFALLGASIAPSSLLS